MQDGNGLTYYTRPREWAGLEISRDEVEGQVIGRQIVGIYPVSYSQPYGDGHRVITGFSIAMQDPDTGQISTLLIDTTFSDDDDGVTVDISDGYIEPEAVTAGEYKP